ALTFQNHTDCPLTDFGGKTSIFSHPVYLFLRKFSLQDSRGGSTSWPNQSQIFSDYLPEAGLTGLLTDASLCSLSNPGKK
ncbi:hypothetical protein ACSLNR_24640, partial [Escherichia coli]|uniref:hypothetical protein n=1 Tax=Escherichia coli TaxID=562 RepID=UPI003EE1E74D